ncbi:hypothetical protein LOTGIDRAFT_164118 [Lottia gigantea]|uniref:Endonuclease/exonuclease/phosphatase domain-containing protein n=1 Tax=Lottia gigantea TaxID=225164 RepID=V4AB56_LOTGI|nr:hypothetical protein LOTGIDRAFT_164118 [Lottia gigantea]ESO90531.1 hypothetical protein LOTGIDRAFT_164118 [Lottia gigantea]
MLLTRNCNSDVVDRYPELSAEQEYEYEFFRRNYTGSHNVDFYEVIKLGKCSTSRKTIEADSYKYILKQVEPLIAIKFVERNPETRGNVFGRFIQLNINGLNVPERKTQLVQLLQRKQYDAVFLQQSKLGSRNKDPIINGYTLIRLNRPNALNHRSGGGLAIYIKNGISHSEVPLKTIAPLEAQALPGTDNIVLGDFNAKHVLWGSPTTDTNGRQVAEFIEANDLVSINDGSITYVGAIAPLGSHLDLTLVSSRLAKDCTWEATSLRVFQQITDNLTKPNQTNDYHSTTNQQEIP